MIPIIIQKTRVLRPSEFEKVVLLFKAKDIVVINALMFSGMRYEELVRLHSNSRNFDDKSGFIHLSSKKRKAKQKERFVRLNTLGIQAMRLFLDLEVCPSCHTFWVTMKRNLKRADFDTIGISPKSFRKSWESWLCAKYKANFLEIVLSQGHTSLTAIQHYLGTSFTKDDIEAMDKYTSGWI